MNNYDRTKDMLNKIRQHGKMIKEEVNITTLSEAELTDEMDNFKEAVGGMVEFGTFKIYDDNIEWTGVLPVEKINWNYSLDSNVGCYVTGDNIQLNDDVLEKLKKLSAYYEIWSAYWTKEIK